MTAPATSKRRRRAINLMLLLVFLLGAGILFYPTLSNAWNRYRSRQLITEYETVVSALPDDESAEILAAARAYNEQHATNVIVDAFNEETEDYVLTHPYDTLLNPMGNMIMGYLQIPKIDVRLAIYHGVGAKTLREGVGHVEGTSLPVGGERTHAVLSAHRGLPSAKLFTDLDQLKVGDTFYLHILDEVLAYEVDQILTVQPDETEALALEDGKDLVTLVTCTPYGVNSHRLLVRGHRVAYKPEHEEAAAAEGSGETGIEEKLLIIGLCSVAAIVLVMWLVFGRRKREESREEPGRHARGGVHARREGHAEREARDERATYGKHARR